MAQWNRPRPTPTRGRRIPAGGGVKAQAEGFWTCGHDGRELRRAQTCPCGNYEGAGKDAWGGRPRG